MIEVENDFKHNPIVREVARLSSELHATGYGMTFLNDEQHDRDKWVWMQTTSRAVDTGPQLQTSVCRTSRRHSAISQFI